MDRIAKDIEDANKLVDTYLTVCHKHDALLVELATAMTEKKKGHIQVSGQIMSGLRFTYNCIDGVNCKVASLVSNRRALSEVATKYKKNGGYEAAMRNPRTLLGVLNDIVKEFEAVQKKITVIDRVSPQVETATQ